MATVRRITSYNVCYTKLLRILDPFTGEVYEDTDPGDGDGRLDDCAGLTDYQPEGVGHGDFDGQRNFFSYNFV